MKRRIASILLALLLIISCIPANFVLAAETTYSDPTLVVESKYAASGTSVEVNISVANNPGIAGAKISVSFSDKLMLIGAVSGDTFATLDYTAPPSFYSSCYFNWDSLDTEVTEDGVLLTLTFETSSEAVANEELNIEVTYRSGDIYNIDLDSVELNIANGCITIINYIPGDVNDDGVVNGKDVTLIRRYNAGYDVTINEAAADVNDDGVINGKDVTLIRRCNAGYNIELKPSTPRCSHTMEMIAFKAATCTEDGNISYYHCTACDKYYNDSNGTVEVVLANTILSATGHTAVTIPAVEPTYTSVGKTEGSQCSVCKEILVSQEEIPMLEEDEYKVTYNMTYNDSYLQSIEIKNPNPSVYTSQRGLKLTEPEIEGYVFEGWYDGQGTSANKVTEIPVGTTGDILLYAHWSKVQYTIIFNSPLAETTSKTYTVDTGATLTNPSYYGYTFVGWSDAYGKLVSKIPAGTTGNITLTANWTSKRNQTVPVASLDDPLIVEDEDKGRLFFAYYIGRMENVPLYTIKDFGYNSGGGITWSETVEYTYSISEENAKSVAKTIAEATTTTSSWSLSQGWNSITSISETQSSSTTAEQMSAYKSSYGETGSYSIGNSVGGAQSTTTEAGISSKVSATASQKTSVSANLGVEDAGLKAGISAGVEVGYSVTGEVGGNYTETEENSKNWSSSSSFEASKSASTDVSVSSSLSSTISEEYNYGQSYESSEVFEESNELAVSSSQEMEYGSTFVYGTDTSTSVTKTYTNEGSTDGYYRLVAAGTIHVFAVVGYDIASSSYFVYTYNVMDDETYEFMDYSATTQGYDDLQNGILAFEVPYEVNTYVDSLTLTTSGLMVDIETGMITGYSGTADHVMIPEYMTVDNGDETASVIRITGIESDAFAGNTSIVEVKLPETITEIPKRAFKDCSSLTGVVASNIISIGEEAFSGCTALASYTIGTQVIELGENAFVNVPSVTVTAYDAAVAKNMATSGAKGITLNLSSMVDTLSDYTFSIPEGTEYFAFNGGSGSYNGVRIISDAAQTIINGATFTGCDNSPLVISSENVTLNRVTVESSGLALQLKAETANVALYGSVNMISSSNNTVRANNVVFSLSNPSVSSKMYVTGNVLVCGTVTNEKYLSVSKGQIICYNGENICVVTFDANGGSCSETTRDVICGTAIGELPVATNPGYVFYGWADESGNVITQDTALYTAGSLTLYAQWIEPYTITWDPGIGYIISVFRTVSLNGNAELGELKSGDSIYPGDELTITYEATTGYVLGNTGATSITVEGDVGSDVIYATATANSYTYNIIYKSSNGTDLGNTTETYKHGTTNTIYAPAIAGYDTPGAQTVTCDATGEKTITFIYTPTSLYFAQDMSSGDWNVWGQNNKYGVVYGAYTEFQNRTANSIQIRVVWQNTLKVANAYAMYGFNQYFSASIGGQSTGNVLITSAGTWSGAQYSDQNVVAVSNWVTVPVSAMQTSVAITANFWDDDGINKSWSNNVTIPAY